MTREISEISKVAAVILIEVALAQFTLNPLLLLSAAALILFILYRKRLFPEHKTIVLDLADTEAETDSTSLVLRRDLSVEIPNIYAVYPPIKITYTERPKGPWYYVYVSETGELYSITSEKPDSGELAEKGYAYKEYPTEIDQLENEWDNRTLEMKRRNNPLPPQLKIEPGGRYKFIVLSKATITNRSPSHKMSLAFVIHLKIKNSPIGVTDYPISEDQLRFLKGHHKEKMLSQPLAIPPEESRPGDLVFVVDPTAAQMFAGVHEEAISPHGAALEIYDHVSGQSVTMTDISELG